VIISRGASRILLQLMIVSLGSLSSNMENKEEEKEYFELMIEYLGYDAFNAVEVSKGIIRVI
jgi:hypothetical protein